MKRFLSLLLMCFIATPFVMADTPHASVTYIKKHKGHKAPKHKAHKATKHKAPKNHSV